MEFLFGEIVGYIDFVYNRSTFFVSRVQFWAAAAILHLLCLFLLFLGIFLLLRSFPPLLGSFLFSWKKDAILQIRFKKSNECWSMWLIKSKIRFEISAHWYWSRPTTRQANGRHIIMRRHSYIIRIDGTCNEITDNIKDSCTVNKIKNEYGTGGMQLTSTLKM